MPPSRALEVLLSRTVTCVDGEQQPELRSGGDHSTQLYLHEEPYGADQVRHAVSISPCELGFKRSLVSVAPEDNSRLVSLRLAANGT